MKQIELTAESREKMGKGAARSLRRQGLTPAIFYGKGIPPQPLTLDSLELKRKLNKAGSENAIFALTIKDDGHTVNKMAMLKEVQTNPLSREIIHTDLYEVAMDKKIVVRVPLHVKGRAKGVELSGILQTVTREIELECLPADIPEFIEVDVTPLDIGESIHIKDLKLPENLHVLDDAAVTLVTVVPPAAEEKAAVAEEEVVAEPEVVSTKGKEPEVKESK
ncbi:MAG: 50S ribosomal protein L25/general stress protein Ctc [Desulfovibrionales bacterium]|nr:50S ribosomal protein L25/general stress protein Ctc [Desulfovibrionales bacterium]